MKNSFNRVVTMKHVVSDVWEAVSDVPSVLSWLSVVREIREVEQPKRYAAVLEDRIGPFRLRADLDIELDEMEPNSHIRAHATGEDRQISARIAVEVTVRMAFSAEGTALTIEGEYELTGRPATLGASAIRRKANTILDEFSAGLARGMAASKSQDTASGSA